MKGKPPCFGPSIAKYEAELAKIYDRKLQLMKDIDADWAAMDIAKSDKYARKALDLEIERAKLKEKYYKRIYKAMSSMAGAKWLQIENMILTALDVQMQAALPLLK